MSEIESSLSAYVYEYGYDHIFRYFKEPESV